MVNFNLLPAEDIACAPVNGHPPAPCGQTPWVPRSASTHVRSKAMSSKGAEVNGNPPAHAVNDNCMGTESNANPLPLRTEVNNPAPAGNGDGMGTDANGNGPPQRSTTMAWTPRSTPNPCPSGQRQLQGQRGHR